jgi:hypothetical protein
MNSAAPSAQISTPESQIQRYVTTDGKSVRLSWCQAPSEAQDQRFFNQFADVGRPLWRQDGSVIYHCCYGCGDPLRWPRDTHYQLSWH